MARCTLDGSAQAEHRCRICLALHSPRFDWAEYLKLAEELANRHGDEAAQRAAISRAYYAAYCSARNKLEDWQLLKRNQRSKTSHQDVWGIFEDDSRPGWEQVGQEGHNMKEDRRKADYEDQIRDLDRFTKKAMRRAKRLNSSLQRLSYFY